MPPSGGQLIDLTGLRFGRLAVLGQSGVRVAPRGFRAITWLCRCDCGSETEVRGQHLRSGATQSCGCLQRERTASLAGSLHPLWQGDEIEYTAAHYRVRAIKGRAHNHSCVDCGQPAGEWSYVGGCPRERISDGWNTKGYRYSPDPERYVARCISCHRRHDFSAEAA